MSGAAALRPVRRRYAEAITGAVPGAGSRLTDAFAAVPREAFLGPPPWTLLRGRDPAHETADAADLYTDALVPLAAARGINNGSPALHARMLHRLDVPDGGRVLHAGAGSGYYTAILAELTGPGGQVCAVEVAPDLARAARANLAPWAWAMAVAGDSAAFPAGPVDRIYVNFAAADIPDRWLDGLAPDGRLVMPLGAPDPAARGAAARHSAAAAVLVVQRSGGGYTAGLDWAVAFICAEGPAFGDAAQRRAVVDALRAGGQHRVRRLLRAQVAGAWLSTPRWSLVAD